MSNGISDISVFENLQPGTLNVVGTANAMFGLPSELGMLNAFDAEKNRFANPLTKEQWVDRWLQFLQYFSQEYGHIQYRAGSPKEKQLRGIAANFEKFESNLIHGNLTVLPQLFTDIQKGVSGINRFSTENQAAIQQGYPSLFACFG